ncbi:MAG: hypothetical protein ACKO23_11250, partial [Gemmataceae bacterium]
MLARSLLDPILNDDKLTRHLGDAEAQILIEWLAEEAEKYGEMGNTDEIAKRIGKLRRRGRAISQFVYLWSMRGERGAALQLAASEMFTWPLPEGPV